MPRIKYIDKNFTKPTLITIKRAIDIIEEYEKQGFTLTLRQLYYQFVSRDFIPNRQKEYDRLGRVISDARLAGYIDWDSIIDRTRNLAKKSHWDDPADIIKSAVSSYNINRWERQPYHVEVWIEKDALIGVIEGVCRDLDVPYFSCRGYVSQSEMWSAGRRLGEQKYLYDKEGVIVLHLGDHDPSGIDMTRDITLRLNDFAVEPHYRENPDTWTDPDWFEYNIENEFPIRVERIALNMNQIRQLKPPPNPAKVTDSRFEGYLREHGKDSWELDALEPQYLADLIRTSVEQYLDPDIWDEDQEREETEKTELEKISKNYTEVKTFIDGIE